MRTLQETPDMSYPSKTSSSPSSKYPISPRSLWRPLVALSRAIYNAFQRVAFGPKFHKCGSLTSKSQLSRHYDCKKCEKPKWHTMTNDHQIISHQSDQGPWYWKDTNHARGPLQGNQGRRIPPVLGRGPKAARATIGKCFAWDLEWLKNTSDWWTGLWPCITPQKKHTKRNVDEPKPGKRSPDCQVSVRRTLVRSDPWSYLPRPIIPDETRRLTPWCEAILGNWIPPSSDYLWPFLLQTRKRIVRFK